MDKNIVRRYVSNLLDFGEKEFVRLIEENRVEITHDRVKDYEVLKADRSNYFRNGNFRTGPVKTFYRTNVRTKNYHFSPSKELSTTVQKEQFRIDFLQSAKKNRRHIMRILPSFERSFFYDMVHGEHNYEKGFSKMKIDKLYEVIQHGKILYSERHFTGGIFSSKSSTIIKLSNLEIEFHCPTEKEFIKKNKELKLFVDSYSCVIEFKSLEKKISKYSDKKTWFQLLRLYKLGSVFSYQGVLKDYYKTRYQNIIGYPNIYRAYYKYKITPRDGDNIKRFVSRYFFTVKEIINLSIPKKIGPNQKLKYSLQVAIERYNELILLKSNDQDKRIAFSIMGLEALYNSDNDKETIGFKLQYRCAKVLGLLDFKGSLIASDIKKAYLIRSKFSHGTTVKDDISFEFERKIINYLRISILVFMNINLTKDNFIKLLTESIWDEKESRNLQRRLMKIKNIKYLILK